jgi:hypothetical protein
VCSKNRATVIDTFLRYSAQHIVIMMSIIRAIISHGRVFFTSSTHAATRRTIARTVFPPVSRISWFHRQIRTPYVGALEASRYCAWPWADRGCPALHDCRSQSQRLHRSSGTPYNPTNLPNRRGHQGNLGLQDTFIHFCGCVVLPASSSFAFQFAPYN